MVQVINLYDPAYTQDFLKLDEHNKIIVDPKRQMMQDMVSQADEIIVCFPLWWFGMPAILKNRRDHTMASGFAYRYRSGKVMPTPLMTGKHIRVVCTTGGPGWFYRTLGYILIVLPFWVGLCQYVGLSLRSWMWICDLPKYKTIESREHIYTKIEKIAKIQDRS
jgi:putative NADPH-quinone reductase